MWMKLRFLFDESMGAIEKPSERSYMGVEETFASPSTSETAYVDDSDVVAGEKIVDIDVFEGADKDRGVSTSECDVIDIGE